MCLTLTKLWVLNDISQFTREYCETWAQSKKVFIVLGIINVTGISADIEH